MRRVTIHLEPLTDDAAMLQAAQRYWQITFEGKPDWAYTVAEVAAGLGVATSQVPAAVTQATRATSPEYGCSECGVYFVLTSRSAYHRATRERGTPGVCSACEQKSRLALEEKRRAEAAAAKATSDQLLIDARAKAMPVDYATLDLITSIRLLGLVVAHRGSGRFSISRAHLRGARQAFDSHEYAERACLSLLAQRLVVPCEVRYHGAMQVRETAGMKIDPWGVVYELVPDRTGRDVPHIVSVLRERVETALEWATNHELVDAWKIVALDELAGFFRVLVADVRIPLQFEWTEKLEDALREAILVLPVAVVKGALSSGMRYVRSAAASKSFPSYVVPLLVPGAVRRQIGWTLSGSGSSPIGRRSAEATSAELFWDVVLYSAHEAHGRFTPSQVATQAKSAAATSQTWDVDGPDDSV